MTDCVFCHPDRPLLAESKLSFAFLDGFPISNGHALIVPKRHIVSIWEMTGDEYADAFNLIRRVRDILQKQFEPHGFNVGVNCGETAGQTVSHAHIHIILGTPETYQIREAECEISFPAKEITKHGSLHCRTL